jgi:uncharacterized OsmC-like protein
MKESVVVQSLDPARYAKRVKVQWPGRDFELTGDVSADHGGTGTGPDGFDLLGAALGQCLLNTLVGIAEREQVELTRAEARVATKVRRAAGEAPRISDLHVDLVLEGVDAETCERLEQAVARECGVYATLTQQPRVTERVRTEAAVARG